MNLPTPNQKISLQVRRLFAAPRERVFRACIERGALQHWLRPGGVEVIFSRLEAHVGGSFQFEGQSADGTRFVTTGTYLEINFPEKLVFTWNSNVINAQETLVTIEFIEQGTSTEVILTHDRFASDARIAVYQQGWVVMLDRLANAVAVLI